MIDVEPLIRDQLYEHVPPFDPSDGDWAAVLARADEPRLRRRRRRLTVLALAGATMAMLVATPLGGALARGVGGFSDWLTGTPGEPAAPAIQEMFDEATPFPGDPQLRELLRLRVGERTFFLYGFETRQVVCLRVAVRAFEGAGPQAACVSRADLRRSGDLVLPVKANLTVGHIGPLPRAATDPPTVPRYLLTFGLAAADVRRVVVEADNGTTRAAVANGAFLHVLEPPRRGVWSRAVLATAASGRRSKVPISVQVSGQPPLATGLRLHGPAKVERVVRGGAIGWFLRREPRGASASEAGLTRHTSCCVGFVRVIQPDPDDFLGVAIGDATMWAGPRSPRFPRGKVICIGVVTRGGTGSGCRQLGGMFDRSPLALTWGFSGGGQQLWLVSGVASDDVTRIRVFLGTGEQWQAPLRDNATAFRVPRAKFPVRIAGYDAAGRVIAVQTLQGG